MPTYAYACTQCGHRFDAVQSFSDAALTVCPECEGTLRKEYGSIGVTFKGSGFYRTDSRSGSGSGEGKTETKTEKKPDSTGSSSGDTGSTSASSSSGAKTPAAPAAS